MDKFLQVIQIICYSLSLLMVVVVPFCLWVYKKIRQLKTADAADRPAIVNDLISACMGFVTDAEKMFYSLNRDTHNYTDHGAGESKLAWVLSQMRAMCISRGITFDEEYWTKYVNDLVEVSSKVN